MLFNGFSSVTHSGRFFSIPERTFKFVDFTNALTTSAASTFSLIKMSVLLRNFKPRQILYIHKVLSSPQDDGVRKCHWFPDYKPDPYPKTKEVREEAAKKYYLLPEEYEPYPDDETGCGDYPKLPFQSVDSKDLWYPWDNDVLKKNFKEPVPFEMIHLLPEGISTGREKFLPGFITLGKLVLFFSIIFYIADNIVYVNHKSEKQYPTPGVVHYTFELEHAKKKKVKDPACEEEN